MEAQGERAPTEQETLWRGDFGRDYIGRNDADRLVASNRELFRTVLSAAQGTSAAQSTAATGTGVTSVVEFGANIGNNLRALRDLLPDARLHALEINATAAERITQWAGATVDVSSIIDRSLPDGEFDLSFTKGVLIHINPDVLPAVYDNLVAASRRWVMVCEYYNPTPVEVTYRGHEHALFKRDFAGEMLDRHPSLRLVDYGFVYHRDPHYPLDDSTWFLMEKQG